MTDGDPWGRVENYRERARTSEEISDADAEALIEFSKQVELRRSTYSDHRHEKLLGHVTRLAENAGGVAAALEDREAAEDIVRYIHDAYDNEESNRDNRIALRVFGKILTDGNEPPESIAWISSTYSKNYDPTPVPENMLRWEEDIKPMIEACYNSRDKALIALAWDLGARPSELHNLQVGNFSDHSYGLKVTIENGKTGTRSPLIVPSVPRVNRWLADHPARDDPDAPLWCQLNSAEQISDRMERKVLEEAADRADVDRPVTRRNFRKSSASYLASQNLNQAYIEDHHGWVRGSRVAARYVATFGPETDQEIAKVHGVDVSEDEADPIGPVDCPRCGRDTPRDEPKCMWCGQVIDHAAAEQIKQDQRSLRQDLIRMARDRPELLDKVDELERLIQLAEDDPELVLDIVDEMDA